MENKLTARHLKSCPPGKHFDGGGLTFVKSENGAYWVFRYSFAGKRKEMGLGAWPTVSLAQAREARDTCRADILADRDPIKARDARREAEARDNDKANPTFAAAVDIAFTARRARLRGGGTRGRWLSPLLIHIIPVIGEIRIRDLHQGDICDAVRPIWHDKHPTAEKCMDRIKIVLESMDAMGYECSPRVATRARHMLGAVDHIEKPIAATPWQEVPDLYARLNSGSPTDECLRFIILTVTRASAARGAMFDEIDGDVWTVPADRMKGTKNEAKDFRVPLSSEARRIAEKSSLFGEKILFPSYTGRPITDAAMSKRLNTLKEAGRTHGFRTSFRTWAQDTDGCAWDVAETALAHSIGSKVERAYARSDLLEKRRAAMETWANFVTGQQAAKVIPIR